MKVIKGVSVSSGIAQGTVCLYAIGTDESIPHYLIPDDAVDHEIERFMNAHAKTIKLQESMIERSKKASHKQAVEIFGAHLSIIKDAGITKKITVFIKEKKVNAEHAVSDVFETYIDRYRQSNNHFAELVHDFVDIRNHLIKSLGIQAGHFVCPIGDRLPVIVAAKMLVPSMLMEIPREHVLAFVTEEGGYTTHATILARSYGVPVLFGIPVNQELKCGDHAIVDSSLSKIIVGPDEKTKKYYDKEIKKLHERTIVCSTSKNIPTVTEEGTSVTLKVNVSTPYELNYLKDIYYDGIGLLRTEFLFQGDTPPSEEVQFQVYKDILEKAHPREVVVRLLDIGTDKLPPYLTLPQQTNPDLGIRGARAVEYFHDIYETQVAALIRAGAYGNLKILFPMVSDLSDLMVYRDLCVQAYKKRENLGLYKQGVMIETPSSALLADQFLQEVDFVNIGSNDLLQYTLAASRGNAFAEKRYHIVHPSLVKLFEIIIAAGKKHNKEVCLCGEIASFEDFYPLFLTLGLRSFSVPVSKYEDIKCSLLFKKTQEFEHLIPALYRTKTKEDLDKLFYPQA